MGMGLPISAAFVIVSLFGAPALMEFGVEPFVSYMFVFLFALTSTITPPVCMASYAAASLSGASYMQVGFRGFILGIAGYIVPFLVIYRPALLVGQASSGTLYAIFISIIGILALAASVEGYFLSRASTAQRIVMLLVAASLLWPHQIADAVGVMGFIAVLFWQLASRKRQEAMELRV
jgi:TRAP-type uncharacterized transport system fused permease subunit